MRDMFLNEKKDGVFIRLGLKTKYSGGQIVSNVPRKSFKKARAENINRMKVHLMFRENDPVITRLQLTEPISTNVLEREIPPSPSDETTLSGSQESDTSSTNGGEVTSQSNSQGENKRKADDDSYDNGQSVKKLKVNPLIIELDFVNVKLP